MPVVAFDAHAATYDRQFTNTTGGLRMRRAVWKRCEARFRPGSSILEMNCGTGEDARWLAEHGVKVLATDISPAMLAVAQAKVDSSLVRFRELAWEDLAALDEGPFDGALSNFGGLNCVEDLRPVAQALAAKLRPGAIAILCIMGPVVPWEWVRFLSKREPIRGLPPSQVEAARNGPARPSAIPPSARHAGLSSPNSVCCASPPSVRSCRCPRSPITT